MLILKIKEKGFYLDIPGAHPTRTPAEIDITRCNLSVVKVYLTKYGIKNYQIYTKDNPQKEKNEPKIDGVIISSPSKEDNKDMEDRFSRLERVVNKLVEKELGNEESKKEQITDKLNVLENLVRESISQNRREKVIEKIKSKEPEIEELNEKFIPDIDISNMKMKGGSKEKVKQDKVDIDDNVDLLSRIMGKDD